MRHRVWSCLFALVVSGGAVAAPPPVGYTMPQPAPAPAAEATKHRGFVMGNGTAATGYFTDRCSYAQPCNNGCGSFRSDAGFVLGSCRSFFAPCGPGQLGHGRGCGPGLLGKHRCGGGGCDAGGLSPGGPFDTCKYDSYTNH